MKGLQLWMIFLFLFISLFFLAHFWICGRGAKALQCIFHFEHLDAKVRGCFLNSCDLCVVVMDKVLFFMLWNVVLFFRICLYSCNSYFYDYNFFILDAKIKFLNPKNKEKHIKFAEFDFM